MSTHLTLAPSLESFITAMPKVELHLHLEGTMQPATLLRIAERNHVELPAYNVEGVTQLFNYRHFHEFLSVFMVLARALKRGEDFELLAYELGHHLADQNVRYAEVMVSAFQYYSRGIDLSEVVQGAMAGFTRAERERGTPVRLAFDYGRQFGAETAWKVLELAIQNMRYGLVAWSIGGDEVNYPPQLFAEVFAAARQAGAHYFDLTEDVEVTRSVRRIAEGARQAFVPQCGLAPGFISIAANELITHFDTLRAVKLRVGALPQHPNNVLKYSLTWSTEGLINEYGNPCEAIVDGRRIEVAPLEGLEEIEIDGTAYEAFNTSGGLGSLAETSGKSCEHMTYKTIRYPGHCQQMRLLMNDLKLNHDRATLKRILENAVPQTLQDVVIVYAAVTGTQDGEFREENYVNKVYPQIIAGRLWSAIQVTTAAGITSVIDLVLSKPGQYHGFVAQENFRLPEILANRFGRLYAGGGGKEVSGQVVVEGRGGSQRSRARA